MAKVKVVHGPPMSGKSTYVRQNIGSRDIVWDYDEAYRAITFRQTHTEPTEAQHQMVMQLRRSFLYACKKTSAETVWIIATKPSDYLKSLLSDDVEYIKMDLSKDECLNRLEHDEERPNKELEIQKIEQYFNGEGEKKQVPVKNDREYRSMAAFVPNENEEYIVEGYASTFEPYVLYSLDGVNYSEQIDARAFDGADFSDVILQYDHEGKVYARQSNGTLQLSVDTHGLKVRADLSKSAGARELYDEIKAGLVTKMSFAFTVDEDDYDKQTHTRTILKIAKVYDVSAGSLPANPSTDISARSYFDGVIEREKQERLRRERQIKKIRLMMEV